MNYLHPDFKKKIREITDLSSKVNKYDKQKVLSMIKEHIIEIEERYNNCDDHWSIETCDLIVLCFELLMLENKDIDMLFDRCIPRFDKKLLGLAKDMNIQIS